MITTNFISLTGKIQKVDLDTSIDLVAGYSSKRKGWMSVVIYDPTNKAFIELRDGPQDFRGNCPSEAEEVPEEYLISTYKINEIDIARFKARPASWKFIDGRTKGS